MLPLIIINYIINICFYHFLKGDDLNGSYGRNAWDITAYRKKAR